MSAAVPSTISCRVCTTGRATPYQTVEGRQYWLCATCAAVFLDAAQLPTPADERARYLLHENDPADPKYREFLTRLATPLLARLPPGAEGLDYGCGPGPALMEMLTSAGHPMTGYDPLFRPDPAALARTYDFITCTEVAEHFHHPAHDFALLATLLRPHGLLALMTALRPPDHQFSSWYYRRDPTHVTFYHPTTFLHLATQHHWHCVFPAKDVVLCQRV